jgi:mRNA interferase RelE/StbE
MYNIQIEKSVVKSLEKISEPYYTQIKNAILKLANNPRPQGYKKLKGRDGFRIRVANYRIIYDINDNILLIEIIEIGHRREVYG